MASKIKLIITADDYGVVKPIDDGIIEGIGAGIINTVTVVVNFKGRCKKSLRRLIVYLKDNNLLNKVGIGLHLNITMGYALTDAKKIPSIVNRNGKFHTQDKYFGDPFGYDFSQIRKEANRQMATFHHHLKTIAEDEGIAAIPIDHITSHFNFFHVMPEMVAILTDICETWKIYGKKKTQPIPVRRPLPSFVEYEDLKNAKRGSASAKKALATRLKIKLDDIKKDSNNYMVWNNLSLAGLGFKFSFLSRAKLLRLVTKNFADKNVRVAHGLFVCFYATQRDFTSKVLDFANLLDDLYEAAVMTGVIPQGKHLYLELVHHLSTPITKSQKKKFKKISGFDAKYIMKFRPNELDIVNTPEYKNILKKRGISHGHFSDMPSIKTPRA